MRKSILLMMAWTAPAWAQQASDHVPPPAPQHEMPAMSDADMNRMMDMDDAARFAMFKLDDFERAHGDGVGSTAWNAEAWYGGDTDKLWLRSEGERESHRTAARIEAFWDRAFASFWDWQLGARHDFGSGPQRDWAAFGVRGLAPYWFEIEATAYAADGGRIAARLRAEYELLLTQRMILQPELELNWYGREDRARALTAGLSDAEFGLRLRYEIRREIAPYVGVAWKYRRDGNARLGGTNAELVAGLRIWF